jgi:hypothetical protein
MDCCFFVLENRSLHLEKWQGVWPRAAGKLMAGGEEVVGSTKEVARQQEVLPPLPENNQKSPENIHPFNLSD